MRRTCLVLFAVLQLGAAAPPADAPRVLLRRAVDAVGGEAELTRKAAVQRKYRAHVKDTPGVGALSVEMLVQAGGSPQRYDLQLGEGTKLRYRVVLDGDRSWRDLGGTVEALAGAEKDALLLTQHLDRVCALLPPLRDKNFSLARLPAIKVDGRPAWGVKVSHEGKPDVHLYFDAGAGYLVKSAYRAKRPGSDKEVLHETVLTDYRAVNSGDAEGRVLAAAGLKADAPSVLAFLKREAPDLEKLKKVRELVKQLGDDEYETREKAEREIVALGKSALPALREAVKARADLEVVRRAERCIRKIDAGAATGAKAAAVRLLALRRPPGAAEALLNLLPGAEDELAAEIQAVLASLAEGGKPDPALVKALADKDPARRAAARAALGKDGGAYLKKPGRRLYFVGPRGPRKQTTFFDGNKEMELEVVETHFFNAIDAKEFARPKP